MVMGKGGPPYSLQLYIEDDMVSYPLKAGNVVCQLTRNLFPIPNSYGIPSGYGSQRPKGFH